MLNKACDHNDGVINTNRITKQPTVKVCVYVLMMQIHLEQHLEKYIENTPVILNEQTPLQLTLWYQILH